MAPPQSPPPGGGGLNFLFFIFFFLLFFFKINHATSSNLYRFYYPHRSRELVSPVCGIFIKIYGVKGQLSRTYFREMESFFSSNFVTQYFVDIFSEPQKSLFTNKFMNCSIFNKTSQKIDLVYLFINITGIKAQLSGSSFMELVRFFFFGFCNVFFCIHRVIYLTDLSVGFITTKIPKAQKKFEKIKYIIV